MVLVVEACFGFAYIYVFTFENPISKRIGLFQLSGFDQKPKVKADESKKSLNMILEKSYTRAPKHIDFFLRGPNR